MDLAASNQAVVQEATTALTTAIDTSSNFASWIGFLSFQQDGDLQKALNIVEAVELGNYTLNDLFIAAQSKTLAGVPTDIAGEPNPTIQVLGNVFEIGSLLAGATVETWLTTNGKTSTYHSREFFTSVGDDAPDGYDQGWSSVNHDPVAEAWTVSATETDTKLNDKAVVDILKIDLLDAAHVSDADGDALTVSNILVGGQPLPSYITLDADGHTLIVDLNSPDLDPIHKDAIQSDSITYNIEDGNGGSTTNTVTLDITGTADQYHDESSVTYSKTAVAEGSGQETSEAFHFNLGVDDGGFDYSGTVTLTVSGDMDAKNENALVVDGGELVDMLPSDPGLLSLTGTGNSGGPQNVDTTGNDGYPTDNVTVSDSTDVAAGGFDDLNVAFDVTVSGQVGNGSTITATLDYDFWA